jgi:hypothetical protein
MPDAAAASAIPRKDDWPVDAPKNVLDLFLHAHKIKP